MKDLMTPHQIVGYVSILLIMAFVYFRMKYKAWKDKNEYSDWRKYLAPKPPYFHTYKDTKPKKTK